MGYGPGQNGVDPAVLTGDENAILDFRFSASPKLTWYFDHHVSAFPTKEEREAYDARVHDDASRRMFHDGGYGSCTKLIADVASSRYGFDASACEELVQWANMIDSAAFPNAEMAVARAEPELELMTVVEHKGGDAFLQAMVPRLLSEPLHEVARGEEIQEAYAPLAVQHRAFIDLVKEHAALVDNVVVVDLSGVVVDVAAKFVTYALWPESAYSVVLSRSNTKCKISVGYNPWSKRPRMHSIATICERYGGGGHPVVGAISIPAHEVEQARAITSEIANELAS